MSVPLVLLKAFAPPVRRGLAVAAAGLVLALTIFTAAPRLHEWLHASTTDHAGDGCAVVLFATGVTLASAAVEVAAQPLAGRAPRALVGDSVVLAHPRHRLQPERGPPAA
jgi:hypothetical protein